MGINGTLQLAGFASSTVALILAISACADRKWRISDYSDNVVESQRRFSGLWTKCIQATTGLESCDTYDHILIGLPDLLLAGRIFTCAGILFFIIGRIIGMMSLSILKTETGEASKAKMTVAAGFVNIVAGLFLGIGATWFAARIAQSFYNPMAYFNMEQASAGGGYGGGRGQISDEYSSGGQRYILGRSLFIAWGAMFTGIAGGVLMVCSAWSAQSEDDDEYEGGMNYAGKNDYTAGQMTMGGGAPGYV